MKSITSMFLINMTLFTSSSNWLSMWMINETSNFMCSFMMYKKINTSIKFYIMQSILSSIIMITLIMNNSNKIHNSTTSNIMTIILMMKINFYPFHQWMESIVQSMNWKVFIIINLLFKIQTLTMIKSINFNTKLINTMMIIFMFKAFKTNSTKMMMFYMSMNNMGWFIMSMDESSMKWTIIMLIYIKMNIELIKLIKHMKITTMNQLNKMNKTNQLALFILTSNLAGIPPMTMFMIKWIMIKSMMNQPTMTTVMTINLVNQMLNMKLTMSSIMMFQNKKSWNQMTKTKKKSMIFTNTTNLIMINQL